MKHKIRVIQEGNHFYPQAKFKSRFENFYTSEGAKVYFFSIQESLNYMSERLYGKQQVQKKIVYKGVL